MWKITAKGRERANKEVMGGGMDEEEEEGEEERRIKRGREKRMNGRAAGIWEMQCRFFLQSHKADLPVS